MIIIQIDYSYSHDSSNTFISGITEIILNVGHTDIQYSIQFNINSTSVNDKVLEKKIIKSFNILGNQINNKQKGFRIELDSKGGVEKSIKF